MGSHDELARRPGGTSMPDAAAGGAHSGLPTPGYADLLTACRETVRRFVALLRADLEPEAAALGAWTARDVAVHVALGSAAFGQMLAGGGSPYDRLEDHPEQAREAVAAYEGERALPHLADEAESHMARFLAGMAELPADREIAWHAGIRVSPASLLALALGEFTLHGYDVARSNRRPWPIPSRHAHMVILGVLPVVPHYVDRQAAGDLRATFEVHVDDLAPLLLRFDRGTLTVTEADGQADCRIKAKAVPFLLASYGRLTPLRAALTGQVRASGRKPWLALRFNRLLRNP
jgi:uncharacterized protein (TIGR03083 family)